ncbi:hypothetical protein ADL29_30845 [Streptomyces chattanoogensis]|uniref:Uncharacterized protein n=1 Tax=Streptomyces chattanoogensis TaxID=66876 RepID=A0A0N0XRP1_9ACTN|nr:hypothetical protein ADL29_30845 [Streptomyces chattanoogensis]
MLGRVLVEEVDLELGVLRFGHDRGRGRASGRCAVVVLAQAVVVQRAVRGVVAGDEPGLYTAGEKHAVDRAGPRIRS